MTYSTEQERFWSGDFGDEYTERNRRDRMIGSNIALFSRILRNASGIRSILEFGANIGQNLMALRQVLPAAELSAIEINAKAATELRKLELAHLYQQSILDFTVDHPRDLVFTKGVLIHIDPPSLSADGGVYAKLYNASAKYVCVTEYYNPSPVEVVYRGHAGKLFKRDFAGDLLQKYPDLRLVDYGFVYKRDHNFPQDDLHWFLLEKTRGA